jgi:membrane associated rhomboid family serine protease
MIAPFAFGKLSYMTEFATPAAALIFAVTIATSLIGLLRSPALIGRLLMRPYQVARGKDVHTVVTSGFVHGSVGHLAFNMFTFFFFAFPLERGLGTARFTVLYVAGLVISSACSLVKHRNQPAYATLGASGAISAVLFAYIIYSPLSTLLVFPIPIPIPAFLFAIGYVAYSWWAGQQQQGNINHDAHLCGAIAGVLFVLLTDPQAVLSLPSRL